MKHFFIWDNIGTKIFNIRIQNVNEKDIILCSCKWVCSVVMVERGHVRLDFWVQIIGNTSFWFSENHKQWQFEGRQLKHEVPIIQTSFPLSQKFTKEIYTIFANVLFGKTFQIFRLLWTWKSYVYMKSFFDNTTNLLCFINICIYKKITGQIRVRR